MSNPQKAYQKAVEIAGTPAALARGIGITPWALSKFNKERIPEERCLAIEKFTNYEVKAEQLRPDINWEYVRANLLSNQQGKSNEAIIATN